MEQPKKIENDYTNNQENPQPAKEAFERKSDKPAGRVLNWVTIIAVVILTIIIFLFYY